MWLVAFVAIVSGQGSLVGVERFAKRHRQTLNELLAQLEWAGFCYPAAKLNGDPAGRCRGARSLRTTPAQRGISPADWVSMAQINLHSQCLGMAIAQTTYATEISGEIQALSQLLEAVKLEGLLVQADMLPANRKLTGSTT